MNERKLELDQLRRHAHKRDMQHEAAMRKVFEER